MPGSPRKRRTPRADRKRPTAPNAGRRIARKAAARARPRDPRAAPAATTEARQPASPRFEAVHAELDGHMRRLFPGGRPVVSYGMPGWRVRRPRKVEWTHGTVDPNFVQVFLAERAQGISLHVWNPYDPDILRERKDGLAAAGFKVMVGCLQFNRKAPYPMDAVVPLLEGIAAAMRREEAA